MSLWSEEMSPGMFYMEMLEEKRNKIPYSASGLTFISDIGLESQQELREVQ